MGVYIYTDDWHPGADTLVYYNISDNDTSSTIYDLSTNHNDVTGTITYGTDATVGKVFTAGRPSRSIINFGNEFTFISWAYYTAATGCIFSNGAGSSSFASNSFFAGWNSTSKIGGLAWGNTANPEKIVLSQSNIPTNQWVMYAYTRDSSGNLKIYLNATLDNTTTIATNPVYPSGTTFMFGGWGGGGSDMNGKIKTLIGENRTWTAEEISNYYNSTKSLYGIS